MRGLGGDPFAETAFCLDAEDGVLEVLGGRGGREIKVRVVRDDELESKVMGCLVELDAGAVSLGKEDGAVAGALWEGI